MVSVTIKSLEQLKTRDGLNLVGLQEYLYKLQENNIEIKKPQHLSEEYFRDRVRMPFLTLLIENIQNRFKNKSILAAFEIFNPKNSQ